MAGNVYGIKTNKQLERIYSREEVLKLLKPDISFLASRDGGSKPLNTSNKYITFTADSDHFWCWGSNRAEVFVRFLNSPICIPCFRVKEYADDVGTEWQYRYIEFRGTYIQSEGDGIAMTDVVFYESQGAYEEPDVGIKLTRIELASSGAISKHYSGDPGEYTLEEIRNFYF